MGPSKGLPLIIKIGSGKHNISQFIAERLTQRNSLSKMRNIITTINFYLG
jgi:hypothetical protein